MELSLLINTVSPARLFSRLARLTRQRENAHKTASLLQIITLRLLLCSSRTMMRGDWLMRVDIAFVSFLYSRNPSVMYTKSDCNNRHWILSLRLWRNILPTRPCSRNWSRRELAFRAQIWSLALLNLYTCIALHSLQFSLMRQVREL